MSLTTVPGALRALLAGLIDYAGLFAPASLPLETAVFLYTRYQTEPERWMLSRFIIPAAKLEQLDLPADAVMPISVLGRGGVTEEQFWEGLAADLLAVQAALVRYGHQLTAEVLEVKLPPSLFAQPDKTAIAVFVERLRQEITNHQPMAIYLEAPLPPTHPNWQAGNLALIHGLALWQQGEKEPGRQRDVIGFKLRCGGVQAVDFPSVSQVAAVVTAAWQAGVPLKATAGLHHPLRHFNDSVETKMHGFLNLFGGGILAAVNNLIPGQLEQILTDEKPTHFRFTDQELIWCGHETHRATLDQIQLARQTQFISYGSCSFDEPREDLRRLVN